MPELLKDIISWSEMGQQTTQARSIDDNKAERQ